MLHFSLRQLELFALISRLGSVTRAGEAMGAKLCHDHPGANVTVSLDCAYIDRPAASFGGYDMCIAPRL